MKNQTHLALAACLVLLTSSIAYSSAGQVSQDFEVSTKSVKRMVGMIHNNVLASNYQQQWLLQLATQAVEKDADTSGAKLGQDLSKRLQGNIETLKKSGIISQKYEDVGIPIRHHKTVIQLKKAKTWIDEQKDNFGPVHFNYMNLLSDLPETLPQLGSNPNNSFWGNGNDAISGVFLYTVVKYYESKSFLQDVDLSKESFPGAVTFFPFYNSEFSIECAPNDFLFSDGMLLAGDYQFGGRRYWSGPLNI